MANRTDPREFSCTDDQPTNTGTFGQDRDWDEIRPGYRNEDFEVGGEE